MKTPFDDLAEKEDAFMLDLALCTLTKKERLSLELYFMDNLTYDKTGKDERLDVTRERTRQITMKALRKMRHPKRLFIYKDCCERFWND